MAVLVTGATGGLGQVLVARLLAEGREVRVLSRRPFLVPHLYQSRVHLHEWHPLSEPVPPEALEGVDRVVHLMGAPFAGGPALAREALAASSRTIATRRLVEAIGDKPIRLVVGSVALAARELQSTEPIGETEVAADDGAYEVRDLLPWETEARAGLERGASVAIVRLGLLAMPGPALATLVRLARRGIVPDMTGVRIAVIDPKDAAAMLSGLVDLPEMTGVVLGVAPEPVRGEALAEALYRAAPLRLSLPLPRRLLARHLGLIAHLLTSRHQLVPRRLVEAGAHFETANPTRCLEDAVSAVVAAAKRRLPDIGLGRKARPAHPVAAARPDPLPVGPPPLPPLPPMPAGGSKPQESGG